MKLFGTDGIRGKANSYPMTPEMAMKIGKAVAKIFRNGEKRHKILIGKDTRLSGYIIETALTSGICSMGVDVYLVGPMPTPAIAYLTRSLGADASIMISASHNPADDNGIKFFSNKGFKLSKEIEEKIENQVFSEDITSDHITGDKIGKAFRIDDAPGRYIEFIKSTINSNDLSGMRAVIDCANGAGYSIAPKILMELGVETIAINDKPDGLNINHKCGAVHLEPLKEAVIKYRADIGISLDGDADRCILVDEKGEEFDGDFIMALVGKYMNDNNKLEKKTIVGTIMSNFGFEKFCNENGINLVRTAVGDKQVVEEMRKSNYNFGGEQSGHIIFFDYGTTGDGILVGVQVLNIMKENNKKLSDLRMFKKIPQVLLNIEVKEKKDFAKIENVKKKVDEIKNLLGDEGRVFVRCSGTQNLCRITVEGDKKEKIHEYSNQIANEIKKAGG
ncbi:MAG: phosphoglucosamine mutase [Candidatus Woesearchaeota archaeon]